MAMTPPDDGLGADSMSPEEVDLAIARQTLRDHTDERWVEVADSMLAEVLARTRPSHSVEGQSDSGTFHVTEQVLTRYLLDAIDTVPHVGVDAIRIHTDQNRYTGITVVITAQHGLPLLSAAEAIRHAARARLSQVLGDQTPPITVSTMHVHVEDVTSGEPGSR